MTELKVIISGDDIVGQTTKTGKNLDAVIKKIAGNPDQFVAHLPGGNVIASINGRTFESVDKVDMVDAYKGK